MDFHRGFEWKVDVSELLRDTAGHSSKNGLFVKCTKTAKANTELGTWTVPRETIARRDKPPKPNGSEVYFACDATDGKSLYVTPEEDDPVTHLNSSHPANPTFTPVEANVQYQGNETTSGGVVMSLRVLPRHSIQANRWVEVIGDFAYTQRDNLYPTSKSVRYGEFLGNFGQRLDFFMYDGKTY